MTSSVYNSNTIVRCDRLDCESAVEEMAYISSLGAPGTDFRIELPFNGTSRFDANQRTFLYPQSDVLQQVPRCAIRGSVV